MNTQAEFELKIILHKYDQLIKQLDQKLPFLTRKYLNMAKENLLNTDEKRNYILKHRGS